MLSRCNRLIYRPLVESKLEEVTETDEAKRYIPRSDAQMREPEMPTSFAQSTFCANVSASSYEIH